MTPVLPCFYPTTTVLIDDDIDTLESLIQVLDLKKKPHHVFIDPREGLRYIQENTYYKTFSKDMMYRDEEDLDEVLSFHPKILLDEIKNPQRYHQVSVLIIDYEMPGIDGLKICQAIDNPYIKKIMLTGVADEKMAISAFNQGLIYQYVRKQDPDFIENLQYMVDKAQKAYFQDIFDVAIKILRNKFLNTAIIEPDFKIYFEELVRKHNIVEYYMVEEIGSFLMVDQNQTIHSLITFDKNLMESHCEIVLTEDLTHQQIDDITQHKLMPCAYDPIKRPHFQISNLSEYLQVPTIIEGQTSTFYCAFGEGFIFFSPDMAIFHKFS
ncbi:MAG: response regulator [Janthinobacterium lividum]